MSIIAWLVLGLLAGWIANMLMSSGRGGLVADLLLGIVGAFVGGFVGSAVFGADVSGLNFTSLVLAVLGAVIVVAIYRVATHQAVRQ